MSNKAKTSAIAKVAPHYGNCVKHMLSLPSSHVYLFTTEIFRNILNILRAFWLVNIWQSTNLLKLHISCYRQDTYSFI